MKRMQFLLIITGRAKSIHREFSDQEGCYKFWGYSKQSSGCRSNQYASEERGKKVRDRGTEFDPDHLSSNISTGFAVSFDARGQ